MSFFQQLLTEESANSRFVYLITNVAVVLCVIALVVATIWKGTPENVQVLDAFIFLVGTLLAGGVGGAAGRWLTGKKRDLPIDSTATKTVTISEKIVGVKSKKP